MSFEKMGIGEPPHETPESNKEMIKKQITKKIRERLEEIIIGSYTADKSYDGGYGEDLFGEPSNLDEIMHEIENMVNSSVSENWPRERFIQELSKIKLNFDFSSYKNYDDFNAFRKEEELLNEFIDIEDIADMLYNE